MKKCIGRRISLLGSGKTSSSILLPLAPMHFWKFSKELRPSTGYHSLSTRTLSNSMLKLYSSAMSNPSFDSRERKDLCEILGKFCSKNFVRHYSSSKECPSDKASKSGECLAETTTKQEVSKDCCSKLDENEEVCPKSSRACPPSFEEQDPIACKPCPDVRDYCPSEEVFKEKFWRMLSILALFVVVVMSGYVYSRELENKKKPRPEFVDVPYLRRITKPFPWGDGKHSFFHNPEKNPISPHGYEAEDPAVSSGAAKK